MILIQLEFQLNIIAANTDTVPHNHPDDPFIYIFSAEDFRKLENKPLNDPDRPDYVLNILGSYFPVPEQVEVLIHLIYQRLAERNRRNQEST